MCKVIHYKDKDKYSTNSQVYIGRPSKWGNPYTHRVSRTLAQYKVNTRQQAIEAYKEWITNRDGKYLLDYLYELKDKILVCWCKPEDCHGDVLAELVSKLKR